MPYLKALCGFACFLILASNVWSMSRWSEARGVYDDVCYLRRGHLFQEFGLGGPDTDISRADESCQGKRFGGANHGGVCAGRLSHRQAVPCRAATAAPPAPDRASRPLDRPGGQFQIAESISLVGIFSVLLHLIFTIP